MTFSSGKGCQSGLVSNDIGLGEPFLRAIDKGLANADWDRAVSSLLKRFRPGASQTRAFGALQRNQLVRHP